MTSRTMRLWCVRHAPVDAQGVCYGQYDVPVRVDAEAAARIVEAAMREPFASVHASPWARARTVAEVLAARAKVPLIIDARLAELSMGEWEGRKFVDLESDACFQRWMQDWMILAPPGGERVSDFRARVASWLDAARLATDGPRLVVAHAGVIRAMRAHVRGIDFSSAMNERVEHLLPELLEL